MRKLSIFLLPLAAILFCACPSKASDSADGNMDSIQEEKPITKLSFLFAGDLMQHGAQYKAALQPDGSYNYDEVFRYIKDEVSSVDVAFANFETTMAGGTPQTYPQFNSPDEYFYAIKDAGFDFLSTCNNHSCDTRAKGINRTIDVMDKAGMPHIGTYKTQADRDKQYPYILEKNGMRIAFLCYTYDTNGIPIPKPCVVNLIDTVQIKKDIKAAKQKKVDCIIAIMHWGLEYQLTPSPKQKQQADWLFAQGVDHIIGGHPHVIQPAEVRTDANGDRHVLAYSLGNYVSNMTRHCNDGGMMLKMTLTKNPNTGKTTLEEGDASYSLFWVSRPPVSRNKNFRIYPASVPDSMLNAEEKALFKKTLTAEREIFEKYNKDIKEYEIPWPKK